MMSDHRMMSNHQTIEDTVRTHPDVAEVAVIWAGLGDERSPRTVALLPALPRDSRGEMDRVELGRILAEDDPPASTYVPPRTPLEAAVAGVLAEVLERTRV